MFIMVNELSMYICPVQLLTLNPFMQLVTRKPKWKWILYLHAEDLKRGFEVKYVSFNHQIHLDYLVNFVVYGQFLMC